MEIQNDARFLACVFEILTKPPRALHKNSSHLSYSLNPLLSPPGGLIYFQHIWGGRGGGLMVLYRDGGLIWEGCILNLAQTMVSFLHKELEYKVEKLKYKKLEVTQPRIKNKSEPPVGEQTIPDQSTRT